MSETTYKVVFDTSVLVAAIRSDRGASFSLLDQFVQGRFLIAISATVVFEYEEILVRELVPAFVSLEEVDQLIRVICKIGEKYDPAAVLRPALADADDDFLLELAVAAKVDYLVTHNIRDFEGAKAFGITVVTPGWFARLLRGKT